MSPVSERRAALKDAGVSIHDIDYISTHGTSTAENDSIVFYLGMKDLVPEKAGKAKLDAIIREEMGHIRLLSKELAAL